MIDSVGTCLEVTTLKPCVIVSKVRTVNQYLPVVDAGNVISILTYSASLSYTMLMMTIDTNYNEVMDRLLAVNSTNTTAYLAECNNALNELYLNIEYNCMNNCESCWDSGTCGLWKTLQTSQLTYNNANFTLEEIVAQDFSSGTTNLKVYSSSTVNYTQQLDGALCFGYRQDPNEDSECFIEYNGVPCTSCLVHNFIGSNSSGCLRADCTNIHSEASINSCLDTGFVGRLEFLHVVRSQFLAVNPFDVGICAMPTELPTRAPVSKAPVTPSRPPVFPTKAPVLPTRPPVVPPTRTPVLSTNAPEGRSRSEEDPGETTESPTTPMNNSVTKTVTPVSQAPSADSLIRGTSALSRTETIAFLVGGIVFGILLLATVMFIYRRHRIKKHEATGDNYRVTYKDQCRTVVRPDATLVEEQGQLSSSEIRMSNEPPEDPMIKGQVDRDLEDSELVADATVQPFAYYHGRLEP